MVVSVETDSHCQRSLDPVHGDTLKQASEALRVGHVVQGLEHSAVGDSADQPLCLHAAPHDVQRIAHILSKQSCAHTHTQRRLGLM